MGLILCFWNVKVYLICWKKYLFKNSIFLILVKLSNNSFTKSTNLGSFYVLINRESEYVTYIFRWFRVDFILFFKFEMFIIFIWMYQSQLSQC